MLESYSTLVKAPRALKPPPCSFRVVKLNRNLKVYVLHSCNFRHAKTKTLEFARHRFETRGNLSNKALIKQSPGKSP